MEKETLVDDELITMWYYPDKKIVHHTIHEYAYGETLRVKVFDDAGKGMAWLEEQEG